MQKVRPKKHLGQHFLNDREIAEKIAALANDCGADRLIEIGPGMGVLTEYLFPVWKQKLLCVEIDIESVYYLKNTPWAIGLKVEAGDFLQMKNETLFPTNNNGVIGNYPYNISTQIAFKVMENTGSVSFFGGMFQMEVAKRFCAAHGNKEYGITSVLLQSLYDCHYAFTVPENAFNPPPKVKSGVMYCTRKESPLPVGFKSLSTVVKTAFSQRRKTLSNALKPLLSSRSNFILPAEWAGQRAEQLSVQDFLHLTQLWEQAT